MSAWAALRFRFAGFGFAGRGFSIGFFVRQLSVLLAVSFVFGFSLRGCLLWWLCLWLFSYGVSAVYLPRFCLTVATV
jgi:hypothetical protein